MKNSIHRPEASLSDDFCRMYSRRRVLELGAAGMLAASFGTLAGCSDTPLPIDTLPRKPLGLVPGFRGKRPNIVFITRTTSATATWAVMAAEP